MPVDVGTWQKFATFFFFFFWRRVKSVSQGTLHGCFLIQLDILVHRLITLMADTGESKSAESRVADATLACRRLAVSHPVLLLRCPTHRMQ